MQDNTKKAENYPHISIYKSRCCSIRVDKSRGNITEEFANEALKLAKDYLTKAKQDPEYAKKQYLADMQKDTLYAEAVRLLNN